MQVIMDNRVLQQKEQSLQMESVQLKRIQVIIEYLQLVVATFFQIFLIQHLELLLVWIKKRIHTIN